MTTPEDKRDERRDQDDENDDDLFARREGRGGRSPILSSFVKKALENVGGSGAHLSKDALAYLLQQGDRGRREVLRIVAAEVGEFLRNTDLSSEVVKILSGLEVEVKANIRFKATGDGRSVTPDVAMSLVESEGDPGDASSDEEGPKA
ncbi:MAG: hypothetical protein HYV07_32140 [Deltaproteobacteria bacterium]|nr:hypothetical protein [Deltaproteobacteria bacterium]